MLAQAYLKELDALTRVRRAIVSHTAWTPRGRIAVAALDARLSSGAGSVLAREDPHVLRACDALARRRAEDRRIQEPRC